MEQAQTQQLRIPVKRFEIAPALCADPAQFVLLRREPDTVIGGRLRDFLPFWRLVTHDVDVLKSVSGVKIPFVARPFQTRVPDPYRFTVEQSAAVSEFITKLLRAGIVEVVPPSRAQFVSPIFLVTNHDLSTRLILDVSRMNDDFLAPRHFQMESLKRVLPLISRNDWFTSLDLVQGFYNVPLHPRHRRYFCFDFATVRYQFRALVMGSSESPRIFSNVVKALVLAARSMDISVVHYLDDTLLFHASSTLAASRTTMFADLLQRAGFFVHPDKSVFTPTQVISYLGFRIDSTTMLLSLPSEKVTRLRTLLRRLLADVSSAHVTTIRQAASDLGFLMACVPAVPYASAHYRLLEYARDSALADAARDYNAKFTWPRSVLPDLEWWSAIRFPTGVSFAYRQFSHKLTTDASLTGWGAICGQSRVSGVWTSDDPCDSINALELLTVYVALTSLPCDFFGAYIHLRIDNQVAMAYVNHGGGRVTRLNSIARRIFRFLESRGATIFASYIPSADNPADSLTRVFTTASARFLDLECQLDPTVFREFVLTRDPCPTIDWFASSLNAQLPRFCSWEFSSNATCYDAFSCDWSSEVGYLFPPFSLIPRVLQKIVSDRASVVLVHPWWPGATWFPRLRQLSRFTLRLPFSPQLLVYPGRPGLLHSLRSLTLGLSWIN